jgi:hypothetical protein
VKLQTQEIVDGQIRENAIVRAATYALENTAVTLTFMLLPPLLKPVLYPIIRRFPPRRLRDLNTARMQLFTAALTLARNAMARLGLPWRDEVNMVANFGEEQHSTTAAASATALRIDQPRFASTAAVTRLVIPLTEIFAMQALPQAKLRPHASAAAVSCRRPS